MEDLLGSIDNCYNSGIISGENSTDIGGLVGFNAPDGDYIGNIKNCYNIGTTENTSKFGSVVGGNEGKIEKCYSLDSASENAIYRMGSSSTIVNDYVLKTAEEMKSVDFVTQLNTENNTISNTGIWKQDTNNINNGYPILNWQ